MQTILGTPYVQPSPEDMQALVRQAHVERAQAFRKLWTALRGRKAEPEGGRTAATYISQRTAA